MHTLLYADDADAARAFFRDILGWPFVDSGGGWLIFRAGPSELGVHPIMGPGALHHEITLMCDDVEATVAELTGKGAQFAGEIRDEGFGRTISMVVPGAGQMMLYEPHHPVAADL